VTVTTNDPDRRRVTLSIKSLVTPQFELSERFIDFREVPSVRKREERCASARPRQASGG
jgi:hypothetical protein